MPVHTCQYIFVIDGRGARCLFGDQTLFCRAPDFWRVGGFEATLPIMEDADLCMRMHSSGASQPNGPCVQQESFNSRSSFAPLSAVQQWARRRGQIVMVKTAATHNAGRAEHSLLRCA